MTQNLWGGRFTEKPDATFAEFNNSFKFDRRLFEADVTASIGHANGLRRAGVLSDADADSIVEALSELLTASTATPDFFTSDAEDVHSFIEARLIDAIGETGKKLHTGRSRNDQVATAFRLWMREAADDLSEQVRQAQSALIRAAERHADAVLPGYTHLQRAQPVMWAHWCLAYFEMLDRDRSRIADARRRINIMPLGSGALAGTGFPVDRAAVAKELGFDGISANSLDAVSDRDFAVEFVNACVLIAIHLSRLAEDLILYTSTEFGFVELSDAVSTGSSLMPQKKNPDALELVRGKSGRILGHQTGLNTMLKGLPLAYNKDMQEDKEAVFDAFDTVTACLKITSIVLDDLSIREKEARTAAVTGFLNATELADHLVRKGVPFRSAHDAVGRIVLFAAANSRELGQLTLEEMKAIAPSIEADVFEVLGLNATLASKSAAGGTSPERVKAALDEAKTRVNQ
ncbi:MAG: argininosuccinate lyase [Acidobacteriota bacterium]